LHETELDKEGPTFVIAEGIRDRGVPEFASTLTKREIKGLATYIDQKIRGVYLDADGNRITKEEVLGNDSRLRDDRTN